MFEDSSKVWQLLLLCMHVSYKKNNHPYVSTLFLVVCISSFVRTVCILLFLLYLKNIIIIFMFYFENLHRFYSFEWIITKIECYPCSVLLSYRAFCRGDVCSEHDWKRNPHWWFYHMMWFIGFVCSSRTIFTYAVAWVLSYGTLLCGAKSVPTGAKFDSCYCYYRHKLWKHVFSCIPTRHERCVSMCECRCDRMCEHYWCM